MISYKNKIKKYKNIVGLTPVSASKPTTISRKYYSTRGYTNLMLYNKNNMNIRTMFHATLPVLGRTDKPIGHARKILEAKLRAEEAQQNSTTASTNPSNQGLSHIDKAEALNKSSSILPVGFYNNLATSDSNTSSSTLGLELSYKMPQYYSTPTQTSTQLSQLQFTDELPLFVIRLILSDGQKTSEQMHYNVAYEVYAEYFKSFGYLTSSEGNTNSSQQNNTRLFGIKMNGDFIPKTFESTGKPKVSQYLQEHPIELTK